MAYNSNKGNQHSGDIQYENDPNDTQIDFENDFVALKTNGNQAFVVSGSLVGIGTSTPGAHPNEKNDLVIGNQTGHRGMTIASGPGNIGTIRFAYATNANNGEGWIDYSNNNKKMRFGTNGLNTRLTIKDTGTDIVGQLSASLGVSGSLVEGSDGKLSLNNTSTGNPQLKATAGNLYIRNTQADKHVRIHLGDDAGATKFQIKNNSDSTKADIDSGGNLSTDGHISSSLGVTASYFLATGSNANASIGVSSPVPTNMLYVSTIDNDNRVPLFVTNTAEQTILAATGSGHVIVGGKGAPVIDAKLNVSGSDLDKLFSCRSDSNAQVFHVSGSGDVFVSGSLGIGTDSPVSRLDINSDSVRLRNSNTPASAGALGAKGEIRWDANYIYVCIATDTWKRVALSTW